jgi:hypothetical protein
MSYNYTQHQEGKIKDVFEDNMIDELRKISELIDEYPYISMVKKIIIFLGYGIPWYSLSFEPELKLYYKEPG